MPSQNRRRFRPQLDPGESCYFHVVSRIVNREWLFDDLAKVEFLSLMRRYEAFGRLRIVGYCLMSNHFHILVEAHGRPEERPGEDELLAHVVETLGETIAEGYRERLELVRAGAMEDAARQAKVAEDDPEAAANWVPTPRQVEFDKVLQDIWQRMHNVSAFVQSLKQQFTVWHNKRTGRVGTLWESRFRSTIVQGGAAVAEMAAYIDLNPVRAGIVDDPKDYRWSQYGAAIGGGESEILARKGVQTVVESYNSLTGEEMVDWNRIQGRYRILLYRRGLKVTYADGTSAGVYDAAEVEKVWAEGGKISGISYATTRIRYFTEGVVIGSKGYVESLFRQNRSSFGPNRKTGARKLRASSDRTVPGDAGNTESESPAASEADWGGLHALRDLRKGVG